MTTSTEAIEEIHKSPSSNIVPGCSIGHYEIGKILGRGGYATAFAAADKRTGAVVAIKFSVPEEEQRRATQREIKMLLFLLRHESSGASSNCIHLKDYFDFQGHTCIVTDCLGMSLGDFMDSTNAALSLTQVQSFAKQLLEGINYLHNFGVTHGDITPRNILLVNDERVQETVGRRKVNRLVSTQIRIIDFGSAVMDVGTPEDVSMPREYKSPEIILGLRWRFPSDVWSLACVLAELVTGILYFEYAQDDLVHLAMMERLCGRDIDQRLIQEVRGQMGRGSVNPAAKYFKGTKLRYYPKDKNREKHIKDIKPLSEITKIDSSFSDLLQEMLTFDPLKRISAKNALCHPWLSKGCKWQP